MEVVVTTAAVICARLIQPSMSRAPKGRVHIYIEQGKCSPTDTRWQHYGSRLQAQTRLLHLDMILRQIDSDMSDARSVTAAWYV